MERVFRKIHIKARTSDYEYWIKQSPQSRIEVLEEMRTEYHRWRYHAEPRLQRVYSIVKRP